MRILPHVFDIWTKGMLNPARHGNDAFEHQQLVNLPAYQIQKAMIHEISRSRTTMRTKEVKWESQRMLAEKEERLMLEEEEERRRLAAGGEPKKPKEIDWSRSHGSAPWWKV